MNREQLLKNNEFSRVKRFEPERVTRTRELKGEEAARKQMIAIALDEARRLGVKT